MMIAIDGIDGAGKTTLAESLARLLAPLNPLLEKEPTEHSEWGRRLKRSAELGRLSRDEELDFFHKDRLHHLRTIVVPALRSGRVVIMDRYVDSTLAYQSRSPAEAEELYNKFLSEIVTPDITLILDCPVEVGLKRIAESRNGNSTFELQETLSLAQRIYQSRQGASYVHIDARGTKEQTLRSAIEALCSRFENLRSVLSKPSTKSKRRKGIDPGGSLKSSVVSA